MGQLLLYGPRLLAALLALTRKTNGMLQAELDFALKEYVGRETPLYFAERLSEHYKR